MRDRLTKVFGAFTCRDFSLLWAGAFTFNVGTLMQSVARSWLVLTIWGKTSYLAWAAVLRDSPFRVFSLFGGVPAERRDRRRILLLSQVVQPTSAFLLAGLVVTQRIEIRMILVLTVVLGLAMSFGGPADQAFVPS